MAEEIKNDDAVDSVTPTDTEVKKEKKKGFLSRLWDAVFRVESDDFEKRLEHISKEESAVLARITRRSIRWQQISRQLIILSLASEVVAVGYAIISTRSLELDWQTRALRVFPMFLLPVLSFVSYSGVRSFTRMLEQKDHSTLERLRTERQEKINELKERTNYYITQQLIQRYDPDPAAKAAAATVLASKLGAETGLKVYIGDDSIMNTSAGSAGGLRHRSPSGTSNSTIGSPTHSGGEMIISAEVEGADLSQQHPLVVEHTALSGSTSINDGWISRLAALLVGEDPSQSYALICGSCHMHNGLAKKEDFPYITYYCPHCKALNQPKQSGDHIHRSNSPNTILLNAAGAAVAAAAAAADLGGSDEDNDLDDEKGPSPGTSQGTMTPVSTT